MHFRILTLLAVLLVRNAVSEELEIKRGKYPYMAFIYYPDSEVVDKNGMRITRVGILVKPDWIITASLETEEETPLAFPKKTLVARLGSVVIDNNFTVNEDEDEQESEIIQVIRPYHFNVVEWWMSDISLLKTLIPFNMTSSVGITPIAAKPNFAEKECFILVFARQASNMTTDRFLMQIAVDVILTSNAKTCGPHFRENATICASDADDNKNVSYSPDFCYGNRGGPLVCENDVNGLQSYSNGCKEPHLYQLFSGWAKFISCGTGNMCLEEECNKICTAINKDTVTTETPANIAVTPKIEPIKLSDTEDNISGEEIIPDPPTVTTKKEEEVTTATHITSSTSPTEKETPVTSENKPTDKFIEDDSRRSNMAAQQQPIKKKNSANILSPGPFHLPIFIWITIVA